MTFKTFFKILLKICIFVLDTRLSGSGDDVYIHEPLHVALHRGLVSSRLLVDTLYGTGLPVRPVHVVAVLKQILASHDDEILNAVLIAYMILMVLLALPHSDLECN